MLRKLLSHAAIYGLAAQLPRVAGVLALPVITPYLTTTDYGVAGVVTAYVTALGVVQSLGLSVVLGNTFVKHPTRYKWVWRQVHGFFILWSVVYNAVLTAVLYFGIPDDAAANRWEIILLQVVPAFLLNHTIFFGGFHYQMQQRPLLISIQSFVVGSLTVALNIYFIAHLRMGYMGWFYAGFVGICVSFLFYVYPVYWREQLWPVFRFKLHRIKSSLLVSVPTIPYHLSSFLLDASDRLVMDVLRVPVQRIGFYNIASSFGLYFSGATYAVEQAARPMYLALYAGPSEQKGQQEVWRTTLILQVLFLTVTSLVALWMKEVFRLLIRNDELRQAYPLAIIILMGYNYRPMHLAVESILAYKEKTGELWKISFVAGAGNVLLNLVLLPVYGIKAAAFTTFAALMYMGYSGFYLKSVTKLMKVNFYPAYWLSATVAMLVAVYFAADVSAVIKAFISGGIILVGGASLLLLGRRKFTP
ncbi:O-antigen/teichoic acid export membrane protein [Pontibacter mucosus]|uniref:O-antigen/teichoic acid export membrane protein n=1 Tax=Pontibacter mucosus TaxID=1649266 RepID=A0A2T5YJY6_9BACT|nr:polysaccharide biosynthesis protein [Pontibacter mucosus]PTX19615.1 O-antigen/teichoic acid export membrane protein [Pontibacter mucosus]